MERDALLAHGTAFLLQDRLMNCSDYTKAAICRECGAFLSTTPTVSEYGRKKDTKFVGGEDVAVVAVPGVLKLLDMELASMGVRLKFKVDP
jgi:DNA-directed RNA polymerase I subunit RPA2